ncbi:MAG: YwiC-like family protein [Actinobacteria bacterium]|nr:YwiC-like family protein [Actinomycetota bacterium]
MAQGRASLIVIPREHGAWAMLFVPYIVGASIAGGFNVYMLAGLAGVLLLFFSRASLALLLKSRAVDGSFGPDRLRRWLNFAFFFATGGAIFLYLVFAGDFWQLGAAAVAGAGLFLVHELLVWRRRERSAAAELTGVALLTLTAPVAVCLSPSDSYGLLAGMLWLLNAMYFGASVFYVKMRLRTSARRRRPGTIRERLDAASASIAYLVGIVIVLLILSATEAIPAGAAAAFIPMVSYQAWGVISGAEYRTLKTEGIAQTVLSVLFALMLISAYRM